MPVTKKSRSQIRSSSLDLCLLAQVPIIDLYKSFVPDYQHIICLGVVRKLFYYYFTNEHHIRAKVTAQQTRQLSDFVQETAKYTPSEFQRRPRRLDTELKHFKATEFRLFLLYLGPYYFKKFLPQAIYYHFLHLHFAIYVMCSESLKHLLPHANRCLEIFVKRMPDHFGRQSVSHNIHAVLHLHEFVERFGNLNNFSAFPFENYLGANKAQTASNSICFHTRCTRWKIYEPHLLVILCVI